MKALYHSFAGTGGDRLVWKLDKNRLRILCYHGVCKNRLAEEQWMPQFFVTESAFESQLQYLQRNTTVLPLWEAVARLQEGTLPHRCVSLTFDDGYANNLQLAYKLLQKYGMPATIFLASSYVESGEFFPFLQTKLIKLSGETKPEVRFMPDYKLTPLDSVMQSASRWWPEIKAKLSDEQRQTLRPLTTEEVQNADPRLIEFGAHSHSHCIFRNETPVRRQMEIQTSLQKVEQWTARPVRLFSYPNGQRGDFNSSDQVILRKEGVQAAVTAIAGANGQDSDCFALRRYPVSLYHDQLGFRAEVSGFRSALLAAGGGWVR